MSDFLKIETIGHVAVATMNRPQTRNALSDDDAIESIVDLCQAINDDLSVRVLVLTGAGPAFSSGGNLKTLRDTVGTGRLHDVRRQQLADGDQRGSLPPAAL